MSKTTIISCAALRLEMEAVTAGTDIRLNLMDIALHQNPQKMPEQLMAAIGECEERGAGEIVMGYGLCSHGVNGLSSRYGMRIARCHDCLGLILGSPARHLEVLAQWPGALYLFAGLLEARADPLSWLERDYAPRLGPQKAMRALELTFKNYTHFAYIDNHVSDDPKYKQRFFENCRAFNKEPLLLEADLSYIRRLVHGPRRPDEDIINLAADERLASEMFYTESPQ